MSAAPGLGANWRRREIKASWLAASAGWAESVSHWGEGAASRTRTMSAALSWRMSLAAWSNSWSKTVPEGSLRAVDMELSRTRTTSRGPEEPIQPEGNDGPGQGGDDEEDNEDAEQQEQEVL